MKDGVSYPLTDLTLMVFIWVVRVTRTTPTAIVTVGVVAATATALVVIATTICLPVSATATSCSCISHHMVLLPLHLLRRNSRFSVKKPGVEGLWADHFRHLIDLLNQRIVISIKTIENI
jgi:hypothetical protein